MAAAAAATRLLGSSVASPARALVSTLPTIPSRFVRRSFCTKRSAKDAAKDLVKVLEESPSEEVRLKAKALVDITPVALLSHYPCCPAESQFTIKQMAARVSKLEKIYETRFLKLELRAKYLTGWAWGSSTVFAASIMALPAASTMHTKM